MTVFVLESPPSPLIGGTLQQYSLKIANCVYATCVNVKVVNGIKQFLIKKKVKFKIVNNPKHGIMPEIAVFDEI